MATVVDVHERTLPLTTAELGAILESLASPDDRLWTTKLVEPMELDAGLELGSRGGHGPVRYHVIEHTTGRSVRFEFEPGVGLEGWHGFDVLDADDGAKIRHTLRANLRGIGYLAWPTVVKVCHVSAIEDMFDRLELDVTGIAPPARRVPLRARMFAPRT